MLEELSELWYGQPKCRFSSRVVVVTLPSLFHMKYIPEQKQLRRFFKASKLDGNMQVQSVRATGKELQ